MLQQNLKLPAALRGVTDCYMYIVKLIFNPRFERICLNLLNFRKKLPTSLSEVADSEAFCQLSVLTETTAKEKCFVHPALHFNLF